MSTLFSHERREALSSRSGRSGARLLDKPRVERANALLDSRELPAKRLAAESGFSSTAHMNRAFERALGMLPRAYRTLHGHADR
jgi:transcriptional regulator GlxA family with amidase domain